jgi:hypothetical protein
MAKIVFVLFQILIPILLLNMLIGKIVMYFSCVNSTHIKYSICLYKVILCLSCGIICTSFALKIKNNGFSAFYFCSVYCSQTRSNYVIVCLTESIIDITIHFNDVTSRGFEDYPYVQP